MAEDTGQDSAARALQAELAAIKDDMARLREDVAVLANALKQVASAYHDEAKAKTREKVTQAKAQVDEQLDHMMAGGRAAVQGMETRVSERPIPSLLAAATFGFVIATLLASGRR